MNTVIINILIYCISTLGPVFVTIILINKSILRKNGIKVTFLWMTFSDIKNMNKLSKEKSDLRGLYYSLLISTIGFLSLFLLAFIVIISEIILRS